MIHGLVMNTQKGLVTVKTEMGLLRCRLRGKLFKEQQTEKSLVVAGDYVFVEHLQGDQGLIVELCERRTKLSRRGAGSLGRHLEQVIAANIDQAILVCSVKNPSYNLNLLDRYIVATEQGGIEPIICFNKIDLVNFEEIQNDVEHYRRYGYQVFCTSTVTGEGIVELREILKDKITVFTGSSGVGKSSLTNSIEESAEAETSHVGQTTRKGRHTTTSSQIYELATGGMIVDTPGMREFGLWDAEDGVRGLFSEIEELAQYCKFRDCSHTKEPGCAVREAFEDGELDEQRYLSYLKLATKKKRKF